MGVECGGEGEGEADREELREEAVQENPKYDDRRWAICARPATGH